MRRFLAVTAASLALLAGHALPAEAQDSVGGTVVGPGYYNDVRWYGTTVCVEDRTPAKSYGLTSVVANAVADWNMTTDLKVWHKRPALGTNCDAYPQRIIVLQGAFGATGFAGSTRYGDYPGVTPAGNTTDLFNSPVTIRLNTTYTNTLGGWDHVITHELGHGFGLAHVTRTCWSVMAWECPWLSKTTSLDRAWINAIYAQ